VSPESVEITRDLKRDLQKKHSPDRFAESTSTIQYGNGTSETFQNWKTCMTDYGGFGKTPLPRKPFKPPKSTL
ncbi:hypothetical protein TL16_g10951, partial [Triparma laevis f. inornata]